MVRPQGYALPKRAFLAVGVIMSSRITFSTAAIRVGMSSHIRRRAIRVEVASRVHLTYGPERVKKVSQAAEIGCPSA